MKAQRVQEWLSLHGHAVVVDGEFGSATETAVKEFQGRNTLPATGVVDQATFDALTAPMKRALQPQINTGVSLGQAIVAVGNVHLKEHPREVGKEQNSGPWVRLYMNGNSGPDWLWCGGFVTFLMKQAAELTGKAAPIKGSFSCDLLATQAKDKGIFLSEKDAAPSKIPPGSLFLLRRVSNDWIHTGVVSEAGAGAYKTMEGNTNDGGSSNGFEAVARTRGYEKKDFVVIA